jgi:DNA helicase-2/ATP-dependent DNA helicase PcrA
MDPTPPQQRAIAWEKGPLLLIGRAGSGKSEVLARRVARLAADGLGPERVIVLTSTRAAAGRLRSRVEALLEGPYEELWVGTWESIAERLLREHFEAAGLDPFFEVVGRAERLAMLLDRFDELPMRNAEEIRGNPAGVLARLLERVDALKAGGEPAEPELAGLCAAHDRILADGCSIDAGDLFLILNRVLDERPEVREQIASRFPQVMVDELEEASDAQRAVLLSLGAENLVMAISPAGGAGEGAGDVDLARRSLPPRQDAPADSIVLEQVFRRPLLRFWSCENERAQAQAVARDVEHLAPWRRRWRSEGSRSISRDRPRSSSGPRSATRSPGCGRSPTRGTRPPRRGL